MAAGRAETISARDETEMGGLMGDGWMGNGNGNDNGLGAIMNCCL